MTVDAGLSELAPGHNIAGDDRRSRKAHEAAAADLAFEEAARLRDEIQRLQRAELLAEASPLISRVLARRRGGRRRDEAAIPGTRARKADRRRHGAA